MIFFNLKKPSTPFAVLKQPGASRMEAKSARGHEPQAWTRVVGEEERTGQHLDVLWRQSGRIC